MPIKLKRQYSLSEYNYWDFLGRFVLTNGDCEQMSDDEQSLSYREMEDLIISRK